jgi:hypothetical protein
LVGAFFLLTLTLFSKITDWQNSSGWTGGFGWEHVSTDAECATSFVPGRSAQLGRPSKLDVNIVSDN